MGQKTHFSQSALKKRSDEIMAKYANGNPDDDGEGRVLDDDGEGGDGSVAVGDDGQFNNGNAGGGDQGEQEGAGGSGADGGHTTGQTEEDPFEAKWKSRTNVLAGKLRSEFGITSDAEQDDSLTAEQRYKLVQADYNAAVSDKRRGGADSSAHDDAATQAAQQAAPAPAINEARQKLQALFGDEQIADSLMEIVGGLADKKVAERIKPVESRVHASDEAEFTGKVWNGPLNGVDHKSQEWTDFNAKPVPFGGGKTFGQLLGEAHAARDFKTFEAVRAEFDKLTGGQQGGQQQQRQAPASGFASIATGGRRSAASVTSDNAGANLTNIRTQLDQARKGAESGDVPWSKVRDLQRQLSQAHGL
jgi:hypothetical protein